jgi:hypothetical protein
MLFQIFGGAAPPNGALAAPANGFALVAISERRSAGAALAGHAADAAASATMPGRRQQRLLRPIQPEPDARR